VNLLSPWSAAIAAAIAIPLLLLLYVLRLRRRHVRIASTLLWQKAFEDLQANVPFQRLRWSRLLLLQLLMLILLLLALGEPVFRADHEAASRLVLLIDRSASMNTIVDQKDGQQRTRLDLARSAAVDLIDSVGEVGGPQQAMVIAFGAQAQVVSTFQSDRATLSDAIRSIESSDEQSNLDAALQLASVFAGTADESIEDRQPPEVVLVSDGGVAAFGDLRNHRLRSGSFRFVQAEPSTEQVSPDPEENLGIVSLGVRRDADDPARVLVFARLVNAAARPRDVVVSVLVDDQAAITVRASLSAASDSGPGEQSVATAVEIPEPKPEGNVIAVRHHVADNLPADDVAAMVLPPPRQPRIALVFPNGDRPDEFLRELVEAVLPQSLTNISEQSFSQMDASAIDAGERFDLIVFDRVRATRLPAVPTISMGAVPAGLELPPQASTSQPNQQGQHILSWDRQHPLMRSVSLDTVVFAGFDSLDLPSGATPLAYGPKGPVMAVLRSRGSRHVVVGFKLLQSNWALHLSSLVFMQNAVDYLTLAASGVNGLSHVPGEAITVRARAGTDEIKLTGPLTASIPVRGSASRMVTLPALPRAGLYRAEGAAAPDELLAVSVLSDVESGNRLRNEVMVNAEGATAAAGSRLSPQPLWPWLIAAAMALLVIEWIAWCRRTAG